MKTVADTADHAARPEDGLGSLTGVLGFHIRLAHGAVYRHFTESFSHLDLTQKQVSVLWMIEEHPGIAQTDLARRLQMDRATVMAIINRLETRGLVAREPSRQDRRRQRLVLLPAGERTLTDARAAVLKHEKWLKARFNDQEIEQLVELLARIHG